MSDWAIGHIRTFTPILAGAIATWLLGFGVEIDSGALSVLLTSLLSGVYYAVARRVERRWPQFGLLLGHASPPRYGQSVPNHLLPGVH